MKTDVVVDVGNSRMKWGLCRDDQVVESVSLPLDSTYHWDEQHDRWNLSSTTRWALSGVNPAAVARFVSWVGEHKANLVVLSSFRHLPIPTAVSAPEKPSSGEEKTVS